MGLGSGYEPEMLIFFTGVWDIKGIRQGGAGQFDKELLILLIDALVKTIIFSWL
jgi:hypothetical protein